MKKILQYTLTSLLLAMSMSNDTKAQSSISNASHILSSVSSSRKDVLSKDNILITGFKPFGIYYANLSENIVNDLHENHGYTHVAVFDSEDPAAAYDSLERIVKEHGIKFVISLGIAGDASEIDFTYFALNGISIKDHRILNIPQMIDTALSDEYDTVMISLKSFKFMTEHLKIIDHTYDVDPGDGACNYFAFKMILEAQNNPDIPARKYFFHIPDVCDTAYMGNIEKFIDSFVDEKIKKNKCCNDE